jgi:hypothetical protein
MEALLDRMLNVPEGFQPTPSQIDVQVVRLLGQAPPPSSNDKSAAEATANPPKGIDGWEEYRRLGSQRRGLTLFEGDEPDYDW